MQGPAAVEGGPQRLSSYKNGHQHGDPSGRTKTDRWNHLWVILGSSFYLYLSLFASVGDPFLLSGDQVFYWMDSVRMMAGEHIYRDFFKFTPPGTDMVYLVAFRLCGLHLWVPNVIVLVLGVLLCWLCFWVGCKFLTQAEALLAAAIFVVFIYGKLLNATHHWFSEMAVLAAVAALMERRNATRVALVGCLLGIATFFTQTRGPAAAMGLAAYFFLDRSLWRLRCQRVAVMLGFMFTTWISLSAYFIATIGWRQLWYWQVVYSFHSKVSGASRLGLTPPAPGHWLTAEGEPLLVYVLLPVMYAFSLWVCWRERRTAEPRREGRLILTLAGLATALEVAQSPNWLRVYCVAASGILLLVWVISQMGRARHGAMGVLWAGILCLALHQIRSRHHELMVTIELPAGKAAMNTATAAKLEWIGQHSKPGDFFFQPQWPAVYLPLLLRNPVYAEGFATTDETRPEDIPQAIEQIEARQVRYILWSPRLNTPADPKRPETYHLTPFRDFMARRYRVVWVFADGDQVWEQQ